MIAAKRLQDNSQLVNMKRELFDVVEVSAVQPASQMSMEAHALNLPMCVQRYFQVSATDVSVTGLPCSM